MYGDKLREKKLKTTEKGNAIMGVCMSKEKVCSLLDEFCSKEDIVFVPMTTVYEMFDEFCEKKGTEKMCHSTLGRYFREHFQLTRKKVRQGKDLYWVYVPKGE